MRDFYAYSLSVFKYSAYVNLNINKTDYLIFAR